MRRPKHSQKKIILASIALDKMAGGLEKNIVHLANEMQGRGYRVYVVTFDLPEAVSFYPLHPDVEWHKMGVSVPHQKISFKDRADSIGKIRVAAAADKGNSEFYFADETSGNAR